MITTDARPLNLGGSPYRSPRFTSGKLTPINEKAAKALDRQLGIDRYRTSQLEAIYFGTPVSGGCGGSGNSGGSLWGVCYD